jgi:hypothetical protein
MIPTQAHEYNEDEDLSPNSSFDDVAGLDTAISSEETVFVDTAGVDLAIA